MRYSIIFITRNKDAIDLLAVSLGAMAKKENQRKRYLDDIAQNTVQQYFQIQSSSKSNGTTTIDDAATTTTTTTASLTLSSSESNRSNANGPTTTTASRTGRPTVDPRQMVNWYRTWLPFQ